MRIPGIVLLATMAGISACSGGDPTTNPPPVATLSVSPPEADLVTNETRQLSAVALDGDGNTLADRAITWKSSSTEVALVTPAGLVTAVAPGSAMITATSEGKSGSAMIKVREGGVVGSDGGTISSADDAVRIVVPSGAVPAGLPITITPTSSPPPPPAAATAVDGTTYVFGPEGTHFQSPATVTIRYDPASLPGWVIPADLVLERWDGTSWSTLTDIVVDPVSHTVTGKTPGFSTVGVYFLNPSVTIFPDPAKVNNIQRSVTLTVAISGEGRNPDALQIAWTNTAANGTLDSSEGSTIQYTAVSPVLPPGDIDGITVVVKGQFEPGGPFEPIGEASTTIRSDLDLVVQLQPSRALVRYSQTAEFTALVIDRIGNLPYDNYLRFEWQSTTNAGTLSPNGMRTTLDQATYTAYPASQQPNVSPKGDKITVKVILVNYTETALLGGGFRLDSTLTELGTAEGFTEVIPEYQVTLEPQSTTLEAGGSVTLTARITPAWQEDEQLFYRWTNTGVQGTIPVAQGAPVTQGSVAYTALANPSGGTDLIDVEVLVGTIGTLGTAHGSVSVNPRTTMEHGALFVAPPQPADPGRSCIWAYIQFPIVADAKQYDMHAFGFNDISWGTSIDRSFTVPLLQLPSFIGASGVNGDSYYFFLTGGCGPDSSIAQGIADITARFAGMQVDVTVKY